MNTFLHTILTESDEQGDEEGNEHLELCHFLEDIVIVFLKGAVVSVQLNVYKSDKNTAYYLARGSYITEV